MEQVKTLVLTTLKTKVYVSIKATCIGVATIQVDVFKYLKPTTIEESCFSWYRNYKVDRKCNIQRQSFLVIVRFN